MAGIAQLAEASPAPGQRALAALLADSGRWRAPLPPPDPARQRVDPSARLPVSPPGTAAARDARVAGLPDREMSNLTEECSRSLPGGSPACELVLADLPPDAPGNEAMVLGATGIGWLAPSGYLRDGQRRSSRGLTRSDKSFGDASEVDVPVLRLRQGGAVLRPVTASAPDPWAGRPMLLPMPPPLTGLA